MEPEDRDDEAEEPREHKHKQTKAEKAYNKRKQLLESASCLRSTLDARDYADAVFRTQN